MHYVIHSREAKNSSQGKSTQKKGIAGESGNLVVVVAAAVALVVAPVPREIEGREGSQVVKAGWGQAE